MATHINKRYYFEDERTGKQTILELDLGAQELSVLQYEGSEITHPYVASLREEHNVLLLISVLDLFTEGCGIKHIEYVTIEG